MASAAPARRVAELEAVPRRRKSRHSLNPLRNFKTHPRRRLAYAMGTACIIAAGLLSRTLPSSIPAVFGKYPGDIFWASMIYTILGMVIPNASAGKLSALSLSICFSVEFLKLTPSETLKSFRYTTVGHLLLGHAFNWQNLIAYSIGVACAGATEMAFSRNFRKR